MLIDLYILCIYVICVLIIRWCMTETDFLDDYDPTAFERTSVTVDLVLLGFRQGSPSALLVKRHQNPFAGHWALPGAFVRLAGADRKSAVLGQRGYVCVDLGGSGVLKTNKKRKH